MSVETVEDLWSIERTSRYLGVPVGTLYQWRHRRTGPRARKVGRHLRYDPADVRAWLRECV
ncbi:helix-turn-helix transcriptional regulator [Actinoplanes aureus]|uniref:Helix-turn-helix domain-containing protein n=1 Tax=Actinoplanes aureus TaxID=2792083 RepID=A0A931G118_9ACTN|nr:helix-turn-helix domain-containing protein [Actinoplanes aureus]MBG0567388.1 helix-turn-helix domain-containing protein [Actinoplanes aureus]